MWNAFFKPVLIILSIPLFLFCLLSEMSTAPLAKALVFVAIFGAALLFRIWINPSLTKFEQRLDRKIDKLSGKRYI